MFPFCAKIGMVLAVAMSLLVGYVAKQWQLQESVAYNILVLVKAYMFPPIEHIFHLSIEEQAAYLDKTRQHRKDLGVSEMNVKCMGGDYWEAMFGKKKTRRVEFSVPSTVNSEHKIPVICACPYSAHPATALPLVLYYFGGGLILGSPQDELPYTLWLADQANAVVCSIGYRLAPKYPYPIPIQDALDGSIAVLENNTVLVVEDLLQTKINPRQIGTWGTSAGGFMAAHMARRLTERGYQLKCQVSNVPMAKPRGGTQSILTHWSSAIGWTGPKNAYSWAVFLPGDDGTLAADWKVSLLTDPPEEVVERLPPTYIQIHTRDILHDEGEL
jgi:acetyl esterase/lipase